MFENCIVPILDYASEIWGFRDRDCINSTQNKIIRYFLGRNWANLLI